MTALPLNRLLDEKRAMLAASFGMKPDQRPDSRRFRLAYRFGCDCETEREHIDRIFGVRP